MESRYKSYHGLADLYVYFVERGIGLLRSNGLLGYIVSSKFIRAGYGAPLRSVLSKTALREIIDYADLQVFEGATTYPVIIIAENCSCKNSVRYVKARPNDEPDPTALAARSHDVSMATLGPSPWTMVSSSGESVLAKIRENAVQLRDVCGPAQLGIKTSLNAAYVIDAHVARDLIEEDSRSKEVIKPYLRGRDVDRWHTQTNGQFLVCMREALNLNEYRAIAKHLRGFERELRDRYEVKRGDYDWWVIRQVADVTIFDGPKIVYPDLCPNPQFALNHDGSYPNNTVFCLRSDSYGVLGFLNSKLGWYWIIQHCPANRGGAYRLFNQYINAIPIRTDVTTHNRLASLVDNTVTLNKKLATEQLPNRREQLQREIDTTDRQIDQLVHQLYGLTDDEIRIVEEATA
ncbi:MAG: hypothetical protein IPK83_00105 [Planctomycetes bacterium]|nr:hypothetical protein [Planctomycetota bacterium]